MFHFTVSFFYTLTCYSTMARHQQTTVFIIILRIFSSLALRSFVPLFRKTCCSQHNDQIHDMGRDRLIFQSTVEKGMNSGLLSFILNSMPNAKRAQAKRWLMLNSILVNGVPQSQFDFEVQPNDVVQIIAKHYRKDKNGNHIIPKKQEDLRILHDDDDLVVVGILRVEGDHFQSSTTPTQTSDFFSIQKNKVAALLAKLTGRKPLKLLLVSKTYKGSTGLVLFAKNAAARDALKKQWASTGQLFVCICHGLLRPPNGCFRSLLNTTLDGATSNHSIPSRLPKLELPVEARTNYRTLETVEVSGAAYSLVELSLDTDFPEQIRVQLAQEGHPLLGDPTYYNLAEESNQTHSFNPFRRIALHASELRFPHPTNGQQVCLREPVPAEFLSLFRRQQGSHLSPHQSDEGPKEVVESEGGLTGRSGQIRMVTVDDFLRGAEGRADNRLRRGDGGKVERSSTRRRRTPFLDSSTPPPSP